MGGITTTETTSNDQNTLTGVPAGTFDVSVKDGAGLTASTTVTVPQPSQLTIDVTHKTDITCLGNDNGSAGVAGKGGTGAYTYKWSTGATTPSISNLKKDTYYVTITDGNGCTASRPFTIKEPSEALSATASGTDITCRGSNNGLVNLTVAGGTAPYTYKWNTSATTKDISELEPGEYSVTVKDKNACTTTASATIAQPAELTGTAKDITHVSCAGGQNGAATISVEGGTLPYTYAWPGGQTTASVENVGSGGYVVTVTDANKCETTVLADIKQPQMLKANPKEKRMVSCADGDDGSVEVNPEGGTLPYTYLWSTGATTASVENLPKGQYGVTVTDDNGCTSESAVWLTEKPTLTALIDITDASCNGSTNGALETTVTGGTTPYTYDWGSATTASGANPTNLAAGDYTLMVTDANGCQVTVPATVSEPAAIAINITSVQHVSCYGEENGAATAEATGVEPLTYEWTNDNDPCAVYYKSVGKCNPVVLEGSSVSGLPAGNYTLRVTDANSCSATKAVVIKQPDAPLQATATLLRKVTCAGGSDGSAEVMAEGGTPPYTYKWANNEETAIVTNATAGNAFMVTVTDANGCTATTTVAIGSNPAVAAQAWWTSDASCNGKADGEAFVDGSGGTGGYTYLWSNGATTMTLAEVPADTYTVTVTDDSGCTATSSVTINEPNILQVDATVDANLLCNGAATGEASVTAVGGSGSYTYEWSNEATTEKVLGLTAATYTVTVTDKNACFVSTEVTITEPSAITADFVTTPDYGLGDGAATAMVTGGVGEYTYVWNSDPQQSSAAATALSAGIYTLTVTDGNACTLVDSVEIVLAGDTCATAMQIDTLLGGELDVAQYSRSFSNQPYGMDTFDNEELIAYFGNDTLHHPIYYRFTGDGNIYHIRTDNCDQDGALTDTRAALFAGACSLDSLIRQSDNYSETDSMPLIEVRTEVGETYTLLIDAGDTTRGNFCLSVMQVATVPTREVVPVSISVYPNPTSTSIRIDNIRVRDIKVYDGYGRRAAHYVGTNNEMDLTGLPSGVYYLRITGDNNRLYTSRVVKQ
ncbi:T9SS type A sorting domain-containing protein [Lewinella sp. IMCC34191]|uniref:T9SS type A sorting domain-containing protein n=1 Tax=Lewinella sp. IMCC34191 TaxID=2259172 RepID=UPI0018E50221|nr:T9SS type A sorting domain-containing protein [Lewinella sp. IMCC34191]